LHKTTAERYAVLLQAAVALTEALRELDDKLEKFEQQVRS
jgi:hypothetical protein